MKNEINNLSKFLGNDIKFSNEDKLKCKDYVLKNALNIKNRQNLKDLPKIIADGFLGENEYFIKLESVGKMKTKQEIINLNNSNGRESLGKYIEEMESHRKNLKEDILSLNYYTFIFVKEIDIDFGEKEVTLNLKSNGSCSTTYDWNYKRYKTVEVSYGSTRCEINKVVTKIKR